MKLIQLFNCMRGKHHRSRGSAHDDGSVMRSKCRGCGKPMVRHMGGWKLDSGVVKTDSAKL
ncbi:MAG: hypothetical protein EOP62_21910 [Sphingomonadales bacterium]|nr:MAG: hypothetical protein EOP62_21910 [Sphingomonadales bacterium]